MLTAGRPGKSQSACVSIIYVSLLMGDPRGLGVMDLGKCLPLFACPGVRFADSVDATSLQVLGLTCYQPLFGFLPESLLC